MRARRQKILDDPEAYRQEQIERKLPDDFEDLTEEERQKIVDQLEGEVLSVDPAVLREELGRLGQLVDHARQLEERDVQSKLLKLRAILQEEGLFDNPRMKLLVFTEHKDTLDYLAGDGRDERPLGTGEMLSHVPTMLHDIVPAPANSPGDGRPQNLPLPPHLQAGTRGRGEGGLPTERFSLPDRRQVELHLYQHSLQPWVERESTFREHEVARIAKHVSISLNALIDRQQQQLGEFLNRPIEGQTIPGLDGIISQAEQHLDELNNRPTPK